MFDGNKIFRPVVGSNPVFMMNILIRLRQSAICIGPYITMLRNVSLMISQRMSGHAQHPISALVKIFHIAGGGMIRTRRNESHVMPLHEFNRISLPMITFWHILYGNFSFLSASTTTKSARRNPILRRFFPHGFLHTFEGVGSLPMTGQKPRRISPRLMMMGLIDDFLSTAAFAFHDMQYSIT